MKRLLSVLLTVALAVSGMCVFTGCTAREEQLKLFSQGEYMDESIFEEFESWYKEQTGEKVTVSMDDFNSNEQMYMLVEAGEADYDLICPSDYTIEKMIKNNLCQKVDKEILDIAQEGLFKEEYLQATRTFDKNLEYSVPYMFGTFGIMYNRTKINKDVTSWAEIFTENRDETIYLKKSIRDTYHAASLFAKRDEIVSASGEAKKQAVQSAFDDTSAENINAVKNIITEWKKGSKKLLDDENGKFEMAQNQGALGLFWSCDAGYVMGDYEDESGESLPGNKNLWYVIPEEGGNIYLDSFVIPTSAKNTKAANYFLKFLCEKEIAKLNSVYCGAVSPVAAAYDELEAEYEEMTLTNEDSVFYGTSEEWKRMYIDMMFPPESVLDRCGQMRDYGANESAVIRAMTDLLG